MSALNDYPILIDISTGRLLRDIGSDVQQQPRPFVQGDSYNLRVMAVRPRPGRNIRRLWEFVPLPSSLYVALGQVGERPTNGTFTLTFGGDTTSALAHNATPAQVQTALNALASITSAGGVTVSGIEGGPYQVAFHNVGARDLITGNANGLFPLTSANIYEARAGDSEVSEIQLIALDRISAALAQTWSDLPAASGSVVEIRTGGTNIPEVQRVSISADAYDGTFLLSFGAASSAPIPFNATSEELTAILEAVSTIGAGNVSVVGEGPAWDVTFIGTLTGDRALMTVDVSGLSVPIGKQGAFNLATAGIESLVGGEPAATAMLEVSGVVEGSHATVLQIEATVLNDGIQNAPQTGPTLPEYYTQSAVDALLAARVLSTRLGTYVEIDDGGAQWHEIGTLSLEAGKDYRLDVDLIISADDSQIILRGISSQTLVFADGYWQPYPHPDAADTTVLSQVPANFDNAAARPVFESTSDTPHMLRNVFYLSTGANAPGIIIEAKNNNANMATIYPGSRVTATLLP